MKKLVDYNNYEKAQHARGVALPDAKEKPNDVDADSAAFMRGYSDRKWDTDYAQVGDYRQEEWLFLFDMLELEDCADYRYQLDQLDKEIFDALVKVAEREHEAECNAETAT